MMKRTIFTLLVPALLGLAMGAGPNESDGTYKIDTENSKLEWEGSKVTGQHFGTIQIKEGSFDVKNGKPANGKVTVDMTTIENKDLSGKSKKKLEGHLRSADFFNVEEHPTSTFELKKIEEIEETKKGFDHQVTGDLTIKGITKEISFPARIKVEEGKLAAYSDFGIDRSRWEVKYGSASFFDNLGDKMIYDEIRFKVKVLAKKQ